MSELAASVERYTAADRARDAAYDELVASIAKALRAGAQPSAVAAVTPFSATWVRALARDAGVPPGRAGRRPSRRRTQKPSDDGGS